MCQASAETSVMLQSILDALFACCHGQTTFPMTRASRTYVVCLDCGREFAYNWANMRVVGPVANVMLPSTTACLAPVAEGRFDGLLRQV